MGGTSGCNAWEVQRAGAQLDGDRWVGGHSWMGAPGDASSWAPKPPAPSGHVCVCRVPPAPPVWGQAGRVRWHCPRVRGWLWGTGAGGGAAHLEPDGARGAIEAPRPLVALGPEVSLGTSGTRFPVGTLQGGKEGRLPLAPGDQTGGQGRLLTETIPSPRRDPRGDTEQPPPAFLHRAPSRGGCPASRILTAAPGCPTDPMGPGGPGGPCEGGKGSARLGQPQKTVGTRSGVRGGDTSHTHVLALIAFAALLSWLAHLTLGGRRRVLSGERGTTTWGHQGRVRPHLVTVLPRTAGGAGWAR